MSAKHLFIVAALFVAVFTATEARAQWIPNYQNYTIQRIGLYGPEYTSSTGLQYSEASLLNVPGPFVAGQSSRFRSVNGQVASNGRSAWIYNPITNATVQIGLTGIANTGSAGFQTSTPLFQNAAGMVVGSSTRYASVQQNIGNDAWVWNGTTTIQIGFTGGVYSGSQGRQLSGAVAQNASGQVTGASNTYSGFIVTGRDSWVWNGTATVQIGLVGPEHTSQTGSRYSNPRFQSESGQIAGTSSRFDSGDPINTVSQDAWVWSTGSTRRIGLVGGEYLDTVGNQRNDIVLQNDAGQVAGTASRLRGVDEYYGQDSWTWNGTSTAQIGLTGGIYTSLTGYQFSTPRLQNQAGQVVGVSLRQTTLSSSENQDAWVWQGSVTSQIGLTGGANTSDSGLQYAVPRLQSASGRVAGYSYRYRSADAQNGRDAWAWNGVISQQIGLTGGANTGSTGFQNSEPVFLNESGRIAGHSRRYVGFNTENGQDAWVWNGAITQQAGLTGTSYSGSAGYRYSQVSHQNEAGVVAGTSARVLGLNTFNGQDAWYFDPVTSLTSSVIGSVRISDNYASSTPTILTEDGFLLGSYTYFAGGVGDGEQRAFVFRPDLGFTDLGNLVGGGLTPSGWSTLTSPAFSDALRTIVGTGYVSGQTSGQSVFAMVRTPAPACVGDLNGDNVVDCKDLTAFLARFGNAVTPGDPGDFNNDGEVNTRDLTRFLGRFGSAC
jgi:hypothetical protein